MSDSYCALVTLIITLAGAVLHPTRAKCPIGMHATGVKPSGAFRCEFNPTCHGDSRGHEPDIPCDQRSGVIEVELYCTGGTRAIMNRNGRAVGCQRGGWSE